MKSIPNKIGVTLVEHFLPQNYDSIFVELKQKEEKKTIHVNHTNEENDNKTFSKEDLTEDIQATKKNIAPSPDKIHYEMSKHLQPEGLDLLLDLYNKF